MAAQIQTDKKPVFNSGLVLPALLAAAVFLGGAHLLFNNVIEPRNRSSVEEAAQQVAQGYAAQLQQFFTQRQQILQQLNTTTRNAPAELAEAQLQFFDQQQIHVGAGEPPLDFALVDLLKRSREKNGKPPQPEFLRDGGDQWQLYNAIGDTRGALLIRQPFSVFARTLAQLDNSRGAIQINQQFPDGPARPLWQSQASNSGIPAASAAVPNTYLKVAFTPSAAFAAEHSIPASWIYALGSIGLLVSIILLWRMAPSDAPAPWEKSARSKTKAGPKKSLRPEDLDAPPGTQHKKPETSHHMAATTAAAPKAEESTVNRRDLMRTPSTDFPQHVFRAYDIRGVAGEEINEPFAYQLGRALGTIALQAGEKILLVARDGRNSSELLRDCLIEGILESGCNAVDLGLVPSPVLYFTCAKGKNTSSGVMVTASHNPAEYNGFKIVMKGRPLAEEKLQKVYALMKSGKLASGEGNHHTQDVTEAYIDEIFNDVALAGQPRVVIDAGNGATSDLAPELFEQLGCAVKPLYCEVDGNFPNHAPDPSRPENLQELIRKVQTDGADLGIALDGDGDRVTLVTASGRIVWADQLVMLLGRDILARNPGSDVVFDVKSSRALADLVTQYGGRPVMWKTGHAPMKTKMLETGALLGGELSGHIFIKDRWYGFDDGAYAAARILEIMALREQTLDELLDSLPQMVNTPEILLPVAEEKKFALIDRLRKTGSFGDADINTIDGLRIEFADGWGLVRASNTGAALTLRFEADDEQALARIRNIVAGELHKIDPALTLPG